MEKEKKVNDSKFPDFIKIGKAMRKEIIPPNSQKIVTVTVPSVKKQECNTVLVQPISKFAHGSIRVGRSVNNVSPEGLIGVVVANFTDYPFHVNKYCRLVTIESIMDVNVIEKENKSKKLPPLSTDDFNLEGIDSEIKTPLISLLMEYKDVFARCPAELGKCNLLYHEINLTSDEPVRSRMYRVPHHLKPVLEEQIQELLEAGIIKESWSPYMAPVLLVRKKDNSYRLVTDLRALNKLVIPSSYPLPRMEDLLEQAKGHKIFSTLDMTSGFWQQEISEKDKHKTGFSTHIGSFEYNRLPQGQRNSPQTFQRLMDIVLSFLGEFNILCFIDDIIICSKDEESHFMKLRAIFERLRLYDLKLSPKKCNFMKTSVKYLGHIVDGNSIRPDPTNLCKINKFKKPTNQKSVRSFLGLMNYYRKFIPNFSQLAAPLTDLTKKGKFKWNPTAEKSFQQLKASLLEGSLLTHPDYTKPFVLNTDASDVAIAAVLQQEDDQGFLRPVAFMSRKLIPAEINYPVIERELLSVVVAVKYWRHYLLGKKFFIKSDHRPLTYLANLKDENSRLNRWRIALSEFDYEINFVKGKSNVVADHLSRQYDGTNETETAQISQEVNVIDPMSPESEVSRVKKLQLKDPNLKPIIDMLETKKIPTETLKVRDSFFLNENGLLCHFHAPEKNSAKEEYYSQLVVPEELKPEVLKSAHDLAAHFGFDKTLSRIRSKYFWLGLYSEVKNYVESCELCQEKSGHKDKDKAKLMRAETCTYPLERLTLDIVGPYPTTLSGFSYILCFVDTFTRFVNLYPLRTMHAKEVADRISEYAANFGYPAEILTDRGQNFMSDVFETLMVRLGIKHLRTSSYHPQTNAVNERLHASLNRALACLISETQDDWDKCLPEFQLAHNTQIHSATGHEPAVLMFGRNLKHPSDILEFPKRVTYFEYDDYVESFMRNLRKSHIIAKENLEHAAEKQEKYRDKFAKEKKLEVGDRVYLHIPFIKKGLSKKLTRLNKGLWEVVGFPSRVNVEIRSLGDKTESQVVHIDRVFKQIKRKPCLVSKEVSEHEEEIHVGTPDTPVQRPRTEDEDESEDEYVPLYDFSSHGELQHSALSRREKESEVISSSSSVEPIREPYMLRSRRKTEQRPITVHASVVQAIPDDSEPEDLEERTEETWTNSNFMEARDGNISGRMLHKLSKSKVSESGNSSFYNLVDGYLSNYSVKNIAPPNSQTRNDNRFPLYRKEKIHVTETMV